MADDSLKIVVTDTLKVHVFDMAVMDLSIRFGYCFIEPIPMIWQVDGKLSMASNMLAAFDGGPMPSKEKFLMQKYKEVIFNSKHMVSPEDWENMKWLEAVTKVEMIQCDITPRSK